MKTSFLQKVLDWLKLQAGKNWKYLVLIAIIIAVTGFMAIRERIIANQAKKIAELTIINQELSKERQALKDQLSQLKQDYTIINLRNDSLKFVLAKKREELDDLIKKHEKEVDSLMKVPADTIYIRLQPIFPNYDNGPLNFPFSGSQVRQIYRVSLAYPRLSEEYQLQSNSLATCLSLNTGYEKGIANLDSQVTNLQGQLSISDKQITNYQKANDLLKKKARKKSIWNGVFKVGFISATAIAILK